MENFGVAGSFERSFKGLAKIKYMYQIITYAVDLRSVSTPSRINEWSTSCSQVS
ncbi:uncharacterized protein ACLA_011400 [Aspergillus clavatus NRRL 1]|uniref:Uncharacterized protein n=1 Tax=Aspergillus clavatus (strain ATCC 1007 / CBS 513.65 / DSM 816 / NCTC 3887 / NRRL 1 / QM 1276 / 107) TaxID=344612 RepID=A1CAE5_ASPCL|nr:uncharacterized protein ACLA_011400 [Aspergillus clavatus NRRL 1]EAW12713.1 hypothetical protein ACLA_011400 [Aspergillus clavatus NRRL 1]